MFATQQREAAPAGVSGKQKVMVAKIGVIGFSERECGSCAHVFQAA